MSFPIPARCAFLILVLCTVAFPAFTQDAWKPDLRIGELQLNIPDGWKRVDTAKGVTLVPKSLDKGTTALISFLPPEELHGDLRAWFISNLNALQQQFKVQQKGDISIERNPNGFELIRTEERLYNAQFGYCSFVFGAAHAGNRVQGYFFLNNGSYYAYHNGLEDMEHTLRFGDTKSGGSPEISGDGKARGLQGVYVGYKIRGLAGLRAHFEYIVFFPDGNLLRELPDKGLNHFNFAEEVKRSRDYCGRYHVNGNEINILWGDNSKENAVRFGTKLNFGHDEYFPASSGDGLKLNGVFRREGADLARYQLRLTEDGRFSDNGLINTITDNRQSPGKGTYTISNYTINFHYADGRIVPFSFYVFPEPPAGQPPRQIHVHTYALNAD